MQLLREIEKYIRRHDTTPARFGRDVVCDPRFVFDLRNGREPRAATEARVRAFFGDGPMMKIAMSPAAAGLLRALFARTGLPRETVLLTQYRSSEWHSLTFAGERHAIGLRVPGPDAKAIVERLLDGIEEAEFTISGQIVADIAVEFQPLVHDDGAISLGLEALTIAD